MAKNTGRGSRVAQPGYVSEYPETMWHRREKMLGQFEDAKRNGGSFKGVTRDEAHARAAKARAAYKRRQVRDSILLAPFKVLLIAANIILVPVMLVFGLAMLALTPLFALVALLRPLVLIAGLITAIVGLATVISGGEPTALIVGVVLLVLGLFTRFKVTVN